jgi:hypothetical protein
MGALYGFAAALGSLQRERPRLGPSIATLIGLKGFCFFLQKEALAFFCLGASRSTSGSFLKKEPKNLDYHPLRMMAVP